MKRFLSLAFFVALALVCALAFAEETPAALTVTGQLELEYATQFRVDFCEGGYSLITNSDGARFLTVPEGASAPEGLDEDIVLLQQPLGKRRVRAHPAAPEGGADADDGQLIPLREGLDGGQFLAGGGKRKRMSARVFPVHVELHPVESRRFQFPEHLLESGRRIHGPGVQ